jgi:plastocyanin
MKPDGTRIFACGYGNDRVYQWNLSTAFDLSTCSYIGYGSLNYESNPAPRGIEFKSDGTKMYLVDSTYDEIYEVSLSNAWDVTSGTLSNTASFSVSSQETSPVGIRFRPDGRSLYLIGETGNDLNEYRLTTAWDLSTASAFTTLSLSGLLGHFGFSWNTDGTQLVVCDGDYANLEIIDCPASNAGTYSFNVTASGSTDYTVSGTDREGSVSGGDPNVYVHVGDTIEFAVSASSHPFYIRTHPGGSNVSGATNQGATNATVSWTPSTAGAYVYQCGSHSGMVGNIFVEPKGYDLSQMTQVGRTAIGMDQDILNNSGATGTGENHDFYHVAISDCLIVDSGSKILLLDPWNSSYDKFSSFSLRVADDVTTLIDGTRGTEGDNSSATYPIDVKWSPHGDKCFVLDDSYNRILQYTATIPFVIDRQNTTYNGASSDLGTSGGSEPKGFDFSPDGTLLFVIFSGSGTDRTVCYQLANPYDVTTTFAELGGSGNNRESLDEIDSTPAGILVRETPSGISIFWHGNENDDIYRQDLLGF